MLLGIESAQPDWIAPIIQFGVGGGVLLWFMFKSEPRLRAIEASIDRMARSILLLVVSHSGSNDALRTQATEIIKEIDVAQNARQQ